MHAKPFGALALVGLLVLPGCLGTAAAGTAQGERPPAEQAAKRWDSGAQLAGVFGIEGDFGAGPMMMGMMGGPGSWQDNGTEWQRTSADRVVGDGICEFWVYGFAAPDRQGVHLVFVDRNGTVLRERDLPQASVASLGDWSVNSDQALSLAKAANQGLATGIASQRWGLAEFLHREQGWVHAHWMVAGGGGGSSGGGGGFVELDAVNGTVLRTSGGFGGGAMGA